MLASAGSGKTRTIVATLAHLVETGTRPEAVMLVTSRAGRRAADGGPRGAAQRRRPVRRDGGDLPRGLPPAAAPLRPPGRRPGGFTILDGEDQAELAAMAREAVLAGREARPGAAKPSAIVGFAALAAERGAVARGRRAGG